MSRLEQLLDDKWPIEQDETPTALTIKRINRTAFTEGYNAAKEEAKAGEVSEEDLRAFHARMQENIAPTNAPLKNE